MPLFTHKKKINSYLDGLADNLNQSARTPMFYTDMGIKDNIQGRLDLLLLHLAILSNGVQDQDVSQYVFDKVFAQIEQSLRQVGVGDLSIPRKMRDIMKASNGLTHAMQQGLETGGENLSEVLHKNLYAAKDEDTAHAVSIAAYVQACHDALQRVDISQFRFEDYHEHTKI